MKKSYYSLILYLLLTAGMLLFCSACEKPAPEQKEQEKPVIAEGLTFEENYSFPPNELLLDWGMVDVGLNWQIEPRKDFQNEIQPEDRFVMHAISNAKGDIVAVLALNYFFSLDDKNSSLTFSYLEQTREDYSYFQEEELPLLWQLLGLLFSQPVAIGDLGEQSRAYFSNYLENRDSSFGGTILWRGRQGDLHCSVSYIWHGGFADYVLSGITLNSTPSFDFELDDTASFRVKEADYPQKPSKVAEIDLNAASAGDPEQYIVKGYLEQLRPNDDILDTSKLQGFPENTDLYQKALLVDETGALPVYILPTSLSESELAEERVHFLTIINAPEPFCLIDLSSTNMDIFE